MAEILDHFLWKRFRNWVAGLFLVWALCPAHAADGILQMRNGYFWNPSLQQYFIPRGIAYQLWNPPVGAVQSFPQVEYDLIEFKKMYANSVRAEFVWSQVEVKDDVYDWSKPDYFVAKAEELGLKLFILIGFQYPPPWFPQEWRGINDRVLVSTNKADYLSDVINFEHPAARKAYQDHIEQLTKRYKNSSAIGAWIVGNEYAYFDLWEDPMLFPARRFIGFDAISQESFRKFLAESYATNIAALNANWGTAYANFNAVVMPGKYPIDRNLAGYHDLIQWRKKSIGDFVGLGAVAAKRGDPNHLITYSMVGGIFSGNDANNTCEDARTIVARCKAAGAPLDFWSLNNYAWAAIGSEMRSADFGIAKYQQQSGLPVMISETGHSSTENLFDEGAAGPRQAKGLPGQLLESLVSGAIGTHFFHWNDRNQYSEESVFFRERGFGIVSQARLPKNPVFDNVVRLFRQLENIRVDRLLGGSVDPRPDVQFLWSTNADMIWPRANQENAMMWGALKRLGFQPGILDDAQFERGDYTNAPALLLSRCLQMSPAHLNRVATDVINAGIHIHADADLPGQFDAYHRPNPQWASIMNTLFGLNVSKAAQIGRGGVTNDAYFTISLAGASALDLLTNTYSDKVVTWEVWHGLTANSGTTVLTQKGADDSQPSSPALVLKSFARSRAAINTFALGDTYSAFPNNVARVWDTRYNVLSAIYRGSFGMKPTIELKGAGAPYVIPDYRLCANGSVLLWLLNEHTNNASFTLSAPGLLAGKSIENLTAGGVLETNSDGLLNLQMEGDDYVLLYAYPNQNGVDQSLVNESFAKVWFESAPTAVWPKAEPYVIEVGFDTQGADLALSGIFERIGPLGKVFSKAIETPDVKGKGRRALTIAVPDPNLNDPDYVSSRNGGQYVFRAVLSRSGSPVSEVSVPVRLLWGVRPVSLPGQIVAGRSYDVPVEWQELPSYDRGEMFTPISRADLFESLKSKREHYNIVLELTSAGQVVATNSFATSVGTDSRNFRINVPATAKGPFAWSAYLQPFPNASDDLFDSFEGRMLGADTQQPTNAPSLIAPWKTDVYSQRGTAQWYDAGSSGEHATDGGQSAFLVATNPPTSGDFAGMFLKYTFQPVWALPPNPSEWKNYSISVDFKEDKNLPCIIELQFKNDDSDGSLHMMHFVQDYNRKGWQTFKATLDQFRTPDYAERFDPSKVMHLVINVQMLQKNEVYIGWFDNIQFDRPERVFAGGTPRTAIYSSANDLLNLRLQRAANGALTLTWPGVATLQSADEIAGPWIDVPRSVSPFAVTPAGARKFYRLRQ